MIFILKKKKHIIVLSLCMITSFILYQLYFFLAITSENGRNKVIPVLDSSGWKTEVHVRSDEDKFINENGLIRGVIGQYMVRYRPDSDNQFRCLKSEQRIPYERVNDDYCDCEDGTDEPSTNACYNGIFNCDTQYQKKPVSINAVPSSRVNDGICDCCDGSDEWLPGPNRKLLSQADSKHYRFYTLKCPNVC